MLCDSKISHPGPMCSFITFPSGPPAPRQILAIGQALRAPRVKNLRLLSPDEGDQLSRRWGSRVVKLHRQTLSAAGPPGRWCWIALIELDLGPAAARRGRVADGRLRHRGYGPITLVSDCRSRRGCRNDRESHRENSMSLPPSGDLPPSRRPVSDAEPETAADAVDTPNASNGEASGEDTDPLPTFGSLPPDFDWGAGLGYTPAASPPAGFPATAERFAFPESSGRTRHHRNRARRLGAAAVAGTLLAGGLIGWLVSRPSSGGPEQSGIGPTMTTTPAGPQRDRAAESRLMAMLPKGYPGGSCAPVDPPKDALAQVDCRANVDSGGPSSASYTLVRDPAALNTAFDAVVAANSVVTCPGNIQSPGPWRRNATPDRVSGTLFCGFDRDSPTVAWTDDARLLLSTVRSDQNGPNLDQLYAWWSSHS